MSLLGGDKPKRREQMTAEDRQYNVRHDPEVHRQWVDDITASPPHMFTTRELEFVESIDGQLTRGRALSDKQIDWLEYIYQRV